MKRVLLIAILLVLPSGCRRIPPSQSLAGTATSIPPGEIGTLVLGEVGGDVWLLAGGDSPRLLTQGEHPLVSPDGCWILVGPEQAAYWLVPVDGSTKSRLFSPHDGWGDLIYALAWTPDSKALLATTGSSAKALPSGDLHRIEVPEGTVTRLATQDAGDPRLSPDGRWIATSLAWTGYTQGAVGLIAMDGADQRLLFSGLFSQSLIWSADSSGVAVALARVHEAGLASWELWWAPVGDKPVSLGMLSRAKIPSWAPDGQRLAYQAADSRMLHIASRDGSQDTTVPKSIGMEPWYAAWSDLAGASPWSPDGRWLLASKVTPEAPPTRYLVDADAPAAPRSLDVDWVHGWLDESHFLATVSAGPDGGLYRCATDGRCLLLIREFELGGASYTHARCIP
jgi:dipeptidyl aminopeptidase/acylaminoacyl peptidase